MAFDFHTHNLKASPGTAIVNLPLSALLAPDSFELQPGGLYSVGIHPWWSSGDWTMLLRGLDYWLSFPQIVALGECGLDKLHGAPLADQVTLFHEQIRKADACKLPVTIHCVRAFGQLLALHREWSPRTQWTVHGFRGKPELARQLLAEGFNLSFGARFNQDSWRLTPTDRRFVETDDDGCEL